MQNRRQWPEQAPRTQSVARYFRLALGLDYSEELKIGEVIDIRFLLEGRTIAAQAEVRWCDQIKSSFSPAAFSLGLKFTNLADADREHISRYVANRASSPEAG
ncbi:MAG: PilZ domain-containing protein [bacterium]|nr:PilZ domain-containing protein [bacterium]